MAQSLWSSVGTNGVRFPPILSYRLLTFSHSSLWWGSLGNPKTFFQLLPFHFEACNCCDNKEHNNCRPSSKGVENCLATRRWWWERLSKLKSWWTKNLTFKNQIWIEFDQISIAFYWNFYECHSAWIRWINYDITLKSLNTLFDFTRNCLISLRLRRREINQSLGDI